MSPGLMGLIGIGLILLIFGFVGGLVPVIGPIFAAAVLMQFLEFPRDQSDIKHCLRVALLLTIPGSLGQLLGALVIAIPIADISGGSIIRITLAQFSVFLVTGIFCGLSHWKERR